MKKTTTVHICRIALVVICLFFSSGSWSQKRDRQHELDSLKVVYLDTTKPLKIQGETLREYAYKSRKISRDSSCHYAKILLAFAQKHKQKRNLAWAHYILGDAYHESTDYKGAVGEYKMSLALFTDLPDSTYMAHSYSYMANAYKRLGELDLAEENFRSALELYKALGNKKYLGNNYGNLARVYASRQNLYMATEYYEKAGRMFESQGPSSQKSLAVNCANLGSIYKQQGDLKRARDICLKGLEIVNRINYTRIKGSFCGQLGGLYSNLGQEDSAFFYYREALALNKLGRNKRKIAEAYRWLGHAFLEYQEFDSAEVYFRYGLEINRSIDYQLGKISSLSNLGNVYLHQGNLTEAFSYLNGAFWVGQEVGIEKYNQFTYDLLYRAHMKMNQADSARTYLEKLVEFKKRSLRLNYSVLSENQKELFFNTMAYNFELLYDFAYRYDDKVGIIDEAYNNALFLKGMMLRSATAMRNSILDSGDSVLIAEFDQWIRLKEVQADGDKKGVDIADISFQCDSLERVLIKNSDAFSDMDRAQNMNWQDVQNKLVDGEVTVEFVSFSHQLDFVTAENEVVYAAMIVDQQVKHPIYVPLCKEDDLKEIVGDYPGNNLKYIESIYGTAAEPNSKLFNLIWKPLEPFLENANRITYSPDGLLHRISFGALSDEEGTLLRDRYDLNLVSSTGNLLNEPSGMISAQEKFTLFGGVDYDSDSSKAEIWTYLEGTKKEVEEISNILEKNQQSQSAYYGQEATEWKFKDVASTSSILHIATHGYFFTNEKDVHEDIAEEPSDLDFRAVSIPKGYASFVQHPNPLMRSGLVFANANDVWSYTIETNDDGVLTTQEVSNLDLRMCKLVVLSACETGLGDIRGSEGVYGLQRSLKVSGVDFMIMSLWQVPDKETAEFMQIFYANLMECSDIRKSFRATQSAMRKKFDPYYWGAFVLIE